MIVENKTATLDKANDISNKLINLMIAEMKDFNCDDDPAEHIYLALHILGNIVAKISFSLKNYGDIYGIDNLTSNAIISWITTISNEIILANKELIN